MDVLVIGASGLVGGSMLRNLPPLFNAIGSALRNVHPGLIRLDMTRREDVFVALERLRPEVVVLCAALTNVDYCEEHPREAERINVEGTRNVAAACTRFGARMVYISTDYVFDGEHGPYSEDDVPNPINVYGRTKLEGELITLNAMDDALVLRTTGVYGYDPDSKNFVMQLLDASATGRRRAVPMDQYATPTLVREIVRATARLLQRSKGGVYNVVGKDLVSRYEFALRVCGVLGIDEDLIVPRTTAELGQSASRPLKCGLGAERLRRDYKIDLSGIDEGLRSFKEEWERRAR